MQYTMTEAQMQKACSMPSAALGKWFESKLQAVFEELQMNYKFKYVRLYDTTSAGNYMPETDGDYILMCAGTGYLAEAKCSAKHKSLVGCASRNISKGQVASQRLWDRAGGVGVFFFGSPSANSFEIWDGIYVAGQRVAGERLSKADGVLLEGELLKMRDILYTFFGGNAC